MKFLFYLSALIIFSVSAVYLWKESRFSTAELISLIAVVVSIVFVSFTFLSKSLPPSVRAIPFNTTVSGLPELNRDWLLQEAVWVDLSKGLTQQGKKLAESIMAQFNLHKLPESREALSHLLKGQSINYNLENDVAKLLIGKKPYSIPLIIGISFINESHVQTVIQEIFLTIKGDDRTFLYKPWFTVEAKKYFTRSFKKTRDFLRETTHPFLLQGKSEHAEYYYFIKEKSYQKGGAEDDSLELSPGSYKLTLSYIFDGTTRSTKLPDLTLREKGLLEIKGGGAIFTYQPTDFYKQLQAELGGK